MNALEYRAGMRWNMSHGKRKRQKQRSKQDVQIKQVLPAASGPENGGGRQTPDIRQSDDGPMVSESESVLPDTAFVVQNVPGNKEDGAEEKTGNREDDHIRNCEAENVKTTNHEIKDDSVKRYNDMIVLLNEKEEDYIQKEKEWNLEYRLFNKEKDYIEQSYIDKKALIEIISQNTKPEKINLPETAEKTAEGYGFPGRIQEQQKQTGSRQETAGGKVDTMARFAAITRTTKETDISMELALDGTGKAEVDTGIGFFDHMLASFARHGFFDLKLSVKGDLYVDAHHTVEDTGIVLGQAIRRALGDKAGIRRYGSFLLPMDEALVMCAIDLSGRPFFNFSAKFGAERVGYFDTELVHEFFYAVSYSAGMNLHLKQMDGENSHHIIEAMFKAFAKALDIAVSEDPRIVGVLSTKGTII